VNTDVFASVLVENLKAPIPREKVKAILLRNIRFLPPEFLEEYQSLIFLEASGMLPQTLDARAFEALCNRVSKRLIYAVKTRNERFVSLESLPQEPGITNRTFDISDALQQLTLEEQNYVLMKMEGLTLREIGGKLGVPVSSVHYHWKKLVEKLKILMK